MSKTGPIWQLVVGCFILLCRPLYVSGYPLSHKYSEMHEVFSSFSVVYNPIISQSQPVKCVLCQPLIVPRSPI